MRNQPALSSAMLTPSWLMLISLSWVDSSGRIYEPSVFVLVPMCPRSWRATFKPFVIRIRANRSMWWVVEKSRWIGWTRTSDWFSQDMELNHHSSQAMVDQSQLITETLTKLETLFGKVNLRFSLDDRSQVVSLDLVGGEENCEQIVDLSCKQQDQCSSDIQSNDSQSISQEQRKLFHTARSCINDAQRLSDGISRMHSCQ